MAKNAVFGDGLMLETIEFFLLKAINQTKLLIIIPWTLPNAVFKWDITEHFVSSVMGILASSSQHKAYHE